VTAKSKAAKARAITAAPCVVMDDGSAHCAGGLGAELARKSALPAGSWTQLVSHQPIRALATGLLGGCLIDARQRLRCFGYRVAVGSGYPDRADVPVAVKGVKDAVQLVAGGEHNCILDKKGAVRCWGGERDLALPQAVAGIGGKVTSLAAGDRFTCALLAQGAISCWGYNGAGPLGRGKATGWYGGIEPPGLVEGLAGPARAIAAGGEHACAIVERKKSRSVYCWGSNKNAELGTGARTLGCGTCVSCAGLADRTRCWGCNGDGAVGSGRSSKHELATNVIGIQAAVQFAPGGNISCARSASGVVSCWGRGALTAIPWHGVGAAVDVSVGAYGACLTTARGEVHCGHPNDASKVVLPPARAVVQGLNHACALLQSGGVRCWGVRTGGVLGDGVPDFFTVPSALAW